MTPADEQRVREIVREEIAASRPCLDDLVAHGRGVLAQIFPQSQQSPAEGSREHEA